MVSAGMTDIIGRANKNETMDERASAWLAQARMHSLMAVVTHADDEWRRSAEAYSAGRDMLNAMIQTTLNAQRKAQVKDLMTLADANERASRALQAIDQSHSDLNAPASRNALQQFKDTAKGVTELSKALAKSYSAAAAERIAEAGAQRSTLMTISVALALVSLALGVTVSFLIARSINRPILALTNCMGALANGNLAVHVPGATGQDEVGEMARAVEVFKDNALRTRELEVRSAEDRVRSEAERRQAEEEAIAREQALVVNSFGSGLKHLTDGDLTHRIDQPLPVVYEPLRADFNGAMTTLEQTVAMIMSRASGIRTGTREIASASDDLSRRTEQQAASLEQTAAAIDEVSATVTKTSEGAGHARKVVESAKADTQTSSKIVLETVEAMGAIERSSNEVSQIIGVIDEIAFQTNLLVLNAGVEAARAGDSGRGFAVVASEVRALAQRSAEAAKEIKTLILASSQQVARGVLLVGETGQALARIATHVEGVNAVVIEMSEASRAQASSLREINAAVNQMDQVTQQNAAMVEESTAAANSLHQETDDMARLVSRFKVSGDPSRQSAGHLQPQTPKQNIAFQRPRKIVGGSGEAQASYRSAAPDSSWEQF